MRHNLSESSSLSGSNYAGLELKIEYLPIDDLKPPPIATRKVSKAHLKRVGRSQKTYGFLVPATVYGDNVLATGTTRVAAAL